MSNPEERPDRQAAARALRQIARLIEKEGDYSIWFAANRLLASKNDEPIVWEVIELAATRGEEGFAPWEPDIGLGTGGGSCDRCGEPMMLVSECVEAPIAGRAPIPYGLESW